MLMDAFGWSWEYIDEEMTLPRMAAISKHWDKIPPLSISLAGIAMALGVKKPEKMTAEKAQSSMDELLGMMGGQLAEGKPEWLTKTE
jgi:hypothetical protein